MGYPFKMPVSANAEEGVLWIFKVNGADPVLLDAMNVEILTLV